MGAQKALCTLILLLSSLSAYGFMRSQLFGNFGSLGVKGSVDPGKPLFLTPYIKVGELDTAKRLSKVDPLPNTEVESYSGYFTVNSTCGGNMFFWFFPALNGNTSAPVLLWLQGGPGGTSMFGLFNEHGPFYLDEKLNLHPRNYTWASKYSVLYIDNPVGTGFSFAEDECYARNEDDVARDLHSALSQFFTVFKEYQSNDFYTTGESYAGKYVPAISLKIHEENAKPESFHINLKGLIIGDGLCDPEFMFPAYAPFMYNIGLLDENQALFFAQEAATAVNYIQNKKFADAFKIFDELLNGDLTGYKAWFYNQTGLDFYYNYLLSAAPKDFNYYNQYLVQDFVRKSIHVGSQPFNDGNKVEMMILMDIMDTIRPRLVTLLDSNKYKVLMYSGMLDIIVALPLTETFLQQLPWSGLEGYKKAERQIWKLHSTDVDVAGYVRVYKQLVQVGVRGGGHILPYDQPARALDMVDNFISNFEPFSSK